MTVSLRVGLLAAIILGGVLGWQWWRSLQVPALPEGIVYGNGRIEAVQVDVAAKYPGRVKEVLVREGDLVEPGQVLARMDSQELDAAHAPGKHGRRR